MSLEKSSLEKVSSVRGVPGFPAKIPEGSPLSVIRVDTREKNGWDFQSVTAGTSDPRVVTVIDTLSTGDYALQIEGKTPKWAAVERKSRDDFLKCCGADRDRFFKQISLLRGTVDRPLLIIEADYTSLEMGDWRGMLTPAQALSTLSIVQQLVPVVLARTRREAERACHRHLRLTLQERYKEAREFARILHAESSMLPGA